MQVRESLRYDMFLRVDAFGGDYLTWLSATSKGAGYRKTVKEVIAQLAQNKVLQQPPRAIAIEVLFDALLLDLKMIAKTARAIQQDEPGFATSFTISDTNPAALLTTADTFILALKKEGIAERFIAYEMAPDFVQHLENDLVDIRKTHADLSSGTTTSVAKTKAIGLAVSTGIKAVNNLDAIVTNKYSRNAEVLRAWQTASHIERTPKREKKNPSTNGTDKPAT